MPILQKHAAKDCVNVDNESDSDDDMRGGKAASFNQQGLLSASGNGKKQAWNKHMLLCTKHDRSMSNNGRAQARSQPTGAIREGAATNIASDGVVKKKKKKKKKKKQNTSAAD